MTDRWRPNRSDPSAWPVLPVQDWADTVETLHLFTQVLGKARTAARLVTVCGRQGASWR